MKKLILLIAIAASLFTAKASNKFEASLFATYDNDSGGEIGSGVGLSYFVTDYLGFSAELQRNGFDGNIDEGLKAFGSMIIRYPNKTKWTPYAFAGVRYDINFVPAEAYEDEWSGIFGLGVSYRLNDSVSIFADGREVFKRMYNNDPLFRLGLTFGF